MRCFDPFSPQVRVNPYPHYQQLRQADPVHWCAANAWFVTRYTDAKTLLQDARLTHWRRENVCLNKANYDSAFEYYSSRWLTCFTPDAVLPLKSIIVSLLGSNALNTIAIESQSLANQLCQTHLSAKRLDVIADFAEPLTLSVVCQILGILPQVRPHFLDVVRGLKGSLFEAISSGPRHNPSGQSFAVLIDELIGQGKISTDGLLHQLQQMSLTHPEMTTADIIPFTLFFIFAGYENMMNFMGNALLALLCYPDEWADLAKQPEKIDQAIPELLRYDSPIQMIRLTAQVEIDIHNQVIKSGEDVLVAVGAANRDPDQFFQPDQLDISRRNVAHLSFGSGALRCMGAKLAHLEAKIAITTLTQVFKHINFATKTLQWRQRPEVLRGLRSLPITFEPY